MFYLGDDKLLLIFRQNLASIFFPWLLPIIGLSVVSEELGDARDGVGIESLRCLKLCPPTKSMR